MARFLLVTWDGGGNLQPMLGIARALAGRGHDVRTMAWGVPESRVTATGSAFVSIDAPFDLDARMWEAQTDETLLLGVETADRILDEVSATGPDAMLVDFMSRTNMCAAEASGVPAAALVHTQQAFFDFPPSYDPEGWGWDIEPVAELRRALSLPQLPDTDERALLRMLRNLDMSLSVMPLMFEDPTRQPIPGMVHVGPVFEYQEETWPEDLPWAPDDKTPLALVAFSSTYMRQEETLRRVATGLSDAGFRVLLTLGTSIGALEEHEVADGPWEVRSHVPHRAVMERSALVVTHAGIGTVMAAMATGTPMLCMPMGRDQPMNAERVDQLGLGSVLSVNAPDEEIGAAARMLTSSHDVARACAEMASSIAAMGGAERAADELERLAGG